MNINTLLLSALLLTSCSYMPGSKNHDFYRSVKEGASCQQGDVRTGFEQPTDVGDGCKRAEQTCVNGVFVGPQLFETCGPKSRDCGTLEHLEKKVGFVSESAPCVEESHQCVDGVIVGPLVLHDKCE